MGKREKLQFNSHIFFFEAELCNVTKQTLFESQMVPYSLYNALGLWSKVVLHIGNRGPFWTQTLSLCDSLRTPPHTHSYGNCDLPPQATTGIVWKQCVSSYVRVSKYQQLYNIYVWPSGFVCVHYVCVCIYMCVCVCVCV